MTRLTCLVMAASLIFLQFVAADDDVKKDQKDNVKPPPAATLTTADIYRIATEAKKEIKSVQVSYDTSQTKLLDLPGHPAYSTYKSRNTFAFLSDGRQMLEQDGYEGIHYTVASFDGKRTYIALDKDITNVVMVEGKWGKYLDDGDSYCTTFLDLPLSDRALKHRDTSWEYPHCLRPGAGIRPFVVRPALEQVNGRWCHVLEYKGMRIFWVDANIGCAVVQWHQLDGDPNKPIVHTCLSCDSFIKVGADLWVPKNGYFELYSPPNSPPQFVGKPYVRTTVAVTNIAINRATAEDVKLDIRPGTIIQDGGKAP